MTMRKHVSHLLVRYVHGQLVPRQRQHVTAHLARCEACRAAYAVHQATATDLATFMPRIGLARRGQLTRLFPTIWRRFQSDTLPSIGWLTSYGVGAVLIIAAVLGFSVLASTPAQAESIPFQQVAPTRIIATATLARTEEPINLGVAPEASETAKPLHMPMASPAPQKAAFLNRGP